MAIQYYVTAAAADGDGDGTEGNPWSIRDAFTNAAIPADSTADTVYVNIQTDGVYDLTESPSGGLTVGNSGDLDNDYKLIFRGYKTTIGDMDAPDGRYYGGALEAYLRANSLSQIKPTAEWADIDGNNIADDIIDLASNDGVEFWGLRVHNTNRASGNNGISAGSGAQYHRFRNCWVDDAFQGIIAPSSSSDGWVIDDCYLGDCVAHPLAGNNANGSIIHGCIIVAGASDICIVNLRHSLALNNILIGGDYGIQVNYGSSQIIGNLFYNQTVTCIHIDDADEGFSEFNNIFMPAAAAPKAA